MLTSAHRTIACTDVHSYCLQDWTRHSGTRSNCLPHAMTAKAAARQHSRLPQKAIKADRRSPKKRNRKALGQAATLTPELWIRWMGHVLQNGSSWLFAALLLTHLLCLRISESLAIRAEDVAMRHRSIYIRPLKGQAAVRKPLLPAVMQVLLQLQKKGVRQKRARNAGSRGLVHEIDHWKWPEKGPLFPSTRQDAKSHLRNKNTVCKLVSRLRAGFLHVTDKPVRSHSGRHSMVNMLRQSGIPDSVAMFYARINDKKTFDKYGCVTDTQAYDILKRSKAFGKLLAQTCQHMPAVRKKGK